MKSSIEVMNVNIKVKRMIYDLDDPNDPTYNLMEDTKESRKAFKENQIRINRDYIQKHKRIQYIRENDNLSRTLVKFKVKYVGYRLESDVYMKDLFKNKCFYKQVYWFIIEMEKRAKLPPIASRNCITCNTWIEHGELFCKCGNCYRIKKKIDSITCLIYSLKL
jgi:hypothetical protein